VIASKTRPFGLVDESPPFLIFYFGPDLPIFSVIAILHSDIYAPHFLFLLMQNEQDVWDNILGVVCNGIEEKNGSRGPSLLVFKAELLIDILCIRFSKVFLGSF